MNILEALRSAVDELDSYETDLLLNAANEIESLQAENEELEKDAARYRWLRDKHDGADEMWFVYGAKSERLDNDIDAAIRELK